ncbi:response regulator [Novosphingobium mangrovi (ex Hu et al. 2023)]|uniref:histidine kinase n=1 Tax=Novosphingobium mangrovi (ex Hu et al. 2023) TaxID=2930094 RepID=A0ABT0A7N2_9SPHN|nr:response regulator [Novosphingobium mangrovi (ex Hu et al. 2023)]MCJ1959186.1 response regulator [Novosphingobium mangrovi (ex Hu et al. 2023)]
MPNEPIKILAVDDIQENLVALEAALDQPGVELVTASSGLDALEYLLKDDFALALLDVQMPGMDGFELAELMRGTERTRGIPIIFLTAVATDERRKFRGFEAGAVDYLLKPLDITILNSKVAVFVELARQRREIANQRDELGAALGRLRAYGDNSLLATLEVDANLRILNWFKGAERTIGYHAQDMIGLRLQDAPFLLDEDRASVQDAIRALLASEGGRAVQDHRFRRADGARREGEWYATALPRSNGSHGSIMLSMIDVTERRRAERTQRLLIGELNHRVKNTLATVQAICSQGFRHARSPEDFQEAFTGRIQALSRAHSLLSATTWDSASLRHLIADQVAIGAIGEDRLRLSGPDIDLPPELALRFSLILHELATNAHKYGALSNETGTVSLSWTREGEWISLCWQEAGGPPVVKPERRGFGSSLIEGSLAADGARIHADYAPEGVRWDLMVPLITGSECAPCDEPETAALADVPASDAKVCAEEAPAPAHVHTSTPPEPLPVPAPQSEPAQTAALPSLDNLRILIVEDEPLVAMELAMEIEDNGGIAIGPASSCEQAIGIIEQAHPDLALLDGNLNGERIDPVADALAAQDTPFAFVSGYDRQHLPANHGHRPMLAKPFLGREVHAVIAELAHEIRNTAG